MHTKILLSLIAIFLVFCGYVPYVLDIFRKKTVPHTFTFFIWGFTTSIAFFLQIAGGGGFGSFVTLGGALFCIFIFFLGFRFGEKNITVLDIVFLVLSLVALFLWLVVKEPVAAVALIVLVDVLGFGPTVRKSWNKPYSETLSLYVIYIIRHALTLFALSEFNVMTALFPATLVVANIFVTIFLLVRRRQVSKSVI